MQLISTANGHTDEIVELNSDDDAGKKGVPSRMIHAIKIMFTTCR